MPNGYQSAFTGQHNDAYDARISAVEAFELRITALEDKTQHITASATNTNFSSNVFVNGDGTDNSRGEIWANSNIINGNNNFYFTRYNNETYPILHNYGNGNAGLDCCGGGVFIGYNNSPDGVYLGDSSATKFHIKSNGQAVREGISTSWISGRSAAMLRTTSCPGWSPVISIKTSSGSWQLGSYTYTGWSNRLVFSYTTDANFNSNTNDAVNCFISTSGAFTNTSKRELKENIKEFDASGLDIINSVKICSFNMKADPEKDYRIGFIADDTDERIAGKNHDVMDLQNCIGVLMKAVQELSQEINQLKEQLNK